MPRSLRLPFVVVVLASSIAAQNPSYVPDTSPQSPVVSGWPFGPLSPGLTIVQPIGVSYVAQTGGFISDLGFSALSDGTFQANQFVIALGHIPNPLPVPFIFPTFGPSGNVTSTGHFLSLTVLYNSANQGPFNVTVFYNHFSPLGLGAAGGFLWDGIHDIGLYLTMQNTSSAPIHGSNFGGSAYAFNGLGTNWVFDPTTYKASVSTTTSISGFKLCLNPPPPIFGQANSTFCRLEVSQINGAGGGTVHGPFVIGIPDSTLTLNWYGPPFMPFVLFAGPQSSAHQNLGCPGIVDIGTPPGYTDVLALMNGLASPFFTLNAGGVAQQTFTLPTLPPQSPLVNIQGVILQPPGSCPILLTAAFYITVL